MIKRHGSQTRVHQHHFVACARVWVKKIFWILWFSDEFCILTNKQICARALPKTLNLPKTKSNHKLLRSSEVHHLLQILNKNHYEELFVSFNSIREWQGFSTHLLILRGSSWLAISVTRFLIDKLKLAERLIHSSRVKSFGNCFCAPVYGFPSIASQFALFPDISDEIFYISLLISECHLSSRFLFDILLHGEQFRIKSSWHVCLHAGMLFCSSFLFRINNSRVGFVRITQNHQLCNLKLHHANIHSSLSALPPKYLPF